MAYTYIDIAGAAESYYNFQCQADFDQWKAGAPPARGTGAGTGTAAVRFGPEFDIKPVHVKAVSDAFGSRLISLHLGDSETGHGTSVTDAAVRHLVTRCPALRELALCSCTQVSDAAFLTVVQGLQKLEVLHCTGHDRSSGKLTSKALDPLLKSKTALPKLLQLYITDQSHVSFSKIEGLLKKRRSLVVQTGETDKWGCVRHGGGFLSYGRGGYGRGGYGR